jgi:leucyl-tRNA synthetase
MLTVFIKLLCPFAPHLCEEIWETLGNEDFLSLSEWPKYDENKTVDKEIEIAVQINGKTRGILAIPVNKEKDKVLEMAKAMSKIAEAMEGKRLIKEIYVPNKIVNFVVK